MSVNFSSPIEGRAAPKGREPNLHGDRYSRLTLVSEIPDDKKTMTMRKWICVCGCGANCTPQLTSIRTGHAKSCGCIQRERAKESAKATGMNNAKHGLESHTLYPTWITMMARCYNEKTKCYPQYGGRGIRVCERWHDVANFVADMASGHQKCLSIDRSDVNGDYCPENCQWATMKTQQRNRRNNRLVDYNGTNITLAEACERSGLRYSTVSTRINKLGWSIQKAIGPEFGPPMEM